MKGDHVLLHLDSRKGAVVPEHLTNNHSVTLKVSYLFQGETKADSEKISSYLRFSGDYFLCEIPWSAVWGMTSDKGDNIVWPEDLSSEALLHAAANKIKSLGNSLLKKNSGAAKEGDPPENSKEKGKKPNSDGPGKVHPLLRRIK